jgi:GNAT superfamily N-acetyltransferase
MLRKKLSRIISPVNAPTDPLARCPTLLDQESLGRLMYEAYRGTIDDAGETPDDAQTEIAKFFAGGYGPLLLECSEVTLREGEIVASTLVTIWKDTPLLAMSMTHPQWKRQGLARASMLRVLNALHAYGIKEVFLAVTDGNPAEALYRSLGFADAV